jgi:serine protease Do
MKKLIMYAGLLIFSASSISAFAQDEKSSAKSETREIIIQKKGDKESNITVQINGDQIMVNGKPLSENNDDNITIKKKRMIITDGNKVIMDSREDDDNGPSSFFSKKTKKPFLGVSTEKDEKGARIANVSEGSAAEKAGLKEGDIITKINDEKIDGPQSLLNAIGQLNAGDEVKIAYIRGDKKAKTLTTTLGVRAEEEETRVFSFGSPEDLMKGFSFPDMGGIFDFSAEPVRKQKLGIKIQDTENNAGVKILEVEDESAGAAAGLLKDDIILEINGHKVTNTDEAREELKESPENNGYRIMALRNGKELNFDVKIPKKLKTADL